MVFLLPVILSATLVPASPRPGDANALQLSAAQKFAQAAADLTVYRNLAIDYQAGRDDTVDRVLNMESERLTAAVALIGTTVDLNVGPWSDALLRATSMMHFDAALRCWDQDHDAALFHVSVARSHLQRLGRSSSSYTGRWILAVSRLMESRSQYLDAERLLEAGRQLAPDDPIVLYESGLLQEMAATKLPVTIAGAPRVRAGQTLRDEWDWRMGISSDRLARAMHNREDRLRKAEGWLRKSLEFGPANIMGRLHFGRVLMMRRSDDESLKQLATVTAQREDAAAAYLAAIFSGAVHERAGRFDTAAAAYQQAIDRFPRGYSAYLALSEVRQRAGQGDESREVLRRLLSESPDSRREPWSWYFFESPDVVMERIAQLRAESRR